jgi:(p)ppGpp synthase/HD superfamily hydrolase
MKLISPGLKSGQVSTEDFNNIVVTAFLHDVVEDCDVSPEEIVAVFGETIAKYVDELTSDKQYIADQMAEKHLKKFEVKGRYLADKINVISPQARLVKLADREDNVNDLSQALMDDIVWVGEYAAETAYILDHIEVELQPVEKKLVASIRKTIHPFLV